MKVAIVAADPNVYAGHNKFASDLVAMLKMYGHQVSLCAWAKPVEGRCYDEFLETEDVYLPSRLSRFAKGELWRCHLSSSSALKRCVGNFKPKVVINAIDEPAIFRVVKRNVKKIQYCHFLTELTTWGGFQKHDLVHLIYRLPYQYLLYRELGNLDAVVCNSRYTLHAAHLLWKHHVSENRFHVIHPAVNTSDFAEKTEKEHKMCYVGRITEEKGIEYAIDAFLKVSEETGILFEIVGGGLAWSRSYYEERLKPRVLKLQRQGVPVRLDVDVPYSRIVETLLTSMTMVSFNPEEHFGIVSVEAQAAGCPPIVARGGGQEETVKHGVTGFLASSPEEIMHYLLLLLSDDELRLKMSQSAREWASRFSRENVALEWNNLLLRLTK